MYNFYYSTTPANINCTIKLLPNSPIKLTNFMLELEMPITNFAPS